MMQIPPTVKSLISEYNKRKPEIRSRLKDFAHIHKGKDKDIFQEMCFCLLTANANALRCDEAIKELRKTGLLFDGRACQLKPKLRGRVRFHNKKADFITLARKTFHSRGRIDIKGKLDFSDVFNIREWLVENIKGYGYKEASHFLRNIGLGKNIAILDRHILKNLKKYGVIDKIPDSVGSRKVYLDIEEKMRRFSTKTGIPLDAMDLLFWSIETGFVFK
jgi:N-glycosylase/DNA lyase